MDTQKLDIAALVRDVKEKREHYDKLCDRALRKVAKDRKLYNSNDLYSTGSLEAIDAAEKAETELKEAEQALEKARQQQTNDAQSHEEPSNGHSKRDKSEPTTDETDVEDVELDRVDNLLELDLSADNEDDLVVDILDDLLKQYGDKNE